MPISAQAKLLPSIIDYRQQKKRLLEDFRGTEDADVGEKKLVVAAKKRVRKTHN